MPVKERGKRLAAHAPKRRLQKILAGISFLVFLCFGILIPFSVFLFALFWLWEGLPLLLGLWREEPSSRSILTGIFVCLGVGMVGGAVAGAWFWVRSLQKTDFVNEQLVWPFGKRRWNQKPTLPADPQTAEALWSSYRWAARVGFAWLSLWALFGVSVALACIIPLGLWIVGQGYLLLSLWEKASLPLEADSIYWKMVISIFLGFLTGTPVAWFQWLRFVRNTLRLTEDDLQHMLRKK